MPKLTEFLNCTVIQCRGVRCHAVYFLQTRLHDTFLLHETHCAIKMRISPDALWFADVVVVLEPVADVVALGDLESVF